MILPGTCYSAIFNLDLELYQNQTDSVDKSISSILGEYDYKFGIDFREKEEEIRSLISKISNIKQISGYSIDYANESGILLSESEKEYMFNNLDSSYYMVSYVINSKIQTIGL